MQHMNDSSTRAMIVFNPSAGQAASLHHALQEATDVWRAKGWSVHLEPTTCAGDGIRLAREAAKQGYDIVVAAGGDGTVNEVVNGLAGTETALAALPVGTVNVWVRELGMPLNPRAAAEAILLAQRQRVDLGRAGDRYFLLMAGVGFDAAVTANVRSDEKRRLGVFAYAWRAISLGLRFHGTRANITVDGKLRRGRVLMVVLGNSQLYGGFVKLTARASLNDGLIDMCIIKGTTLLRSGPLRVLSILTRRHNRDSEVEYHRARTVHIESQVALPVQVDGDHIGHTPMTFEAVPNALYVLLPADLPPELVRKEPSLTQHPMELLLRWVVRRRTHRVDDELVPDEQTPEETLVH
jgi:YegS/Rv2252/BmrU family lipid kinase